MAEVVVHEIATGDAVRKVPWIGAPFAEGVAAYKRSERRAGALFVYAAQLPAIAGHCREAVKTALIGEGVDPVEGEYLAYIKVGRARN